MYLVLLVLVAFSGIHCELCNILDDQGEKDKIYCEIGCCGPLEDSYCCVEDASSFEDYYYGYKVAGAVVGSIFGLLVIIAAGRCIYAIWRDATVFVTTVEPGACGDINVTTSAEQRETGNIPMQRPATISYSEDDSYPTGLPILYRDKANNDQQKLVM